MTPLAAAETLAREATPQRFALAVAAVLACYFAVTFVHAPIEAALRGAACDGLSCLKPRRPDTRFGGYGATEFRLYLDAIWGLRGRALFGVAIDLPLTAAVTVALLTGAGLAAPPMLPLSDRTRRLLVIMPLAYAASDLVENALLVLAYAGAVDVAPVVPWASALKFGTAAASGAVSLVLGLMRATA